MESNKEIEQAWEFVEHTGRSVFLTGRAGTGKTTFLKQVQAATTKRTVVVAPTGVAAMNAGGVTIHSFFQLPTAPYVPGAVIQGKFSFSKVKRDIIRSLDLLIIDEVSMVRADLLDAVSHVLQRFRRSAQPFGGVQLLMIGDLQQLTPVVTAEEAPLLRRYYDTPYFFGSKALSLTQYVTIELQQVFRQQSGPFLDILNNIRAGRATFKDLQPLNERYNPTFHPKAGEGYIRLTTHNHRADNYNTTELSHLPSAPVTFKAEITGTFPEYLYPTATELILKVGAQVMFVKNDPSTDHLYYNGRIGVVSDISDGEVWVTCKADNVHVKPLEWQNTAYTLNEETHEIESEVKGTFRQLPLRLAWAITIHKSQGLTFDKAIIEADAAFAPGQVYVALSRCRTLEGIVMAARIGLDVIINDRDVDHYISTQERSTAQAVTQLDTIKREYYKSLLIELFTFTDIRNAEEALLRCFIENLETHYPALIAAHKAVIESLKGDIATVANKWVSVIRAMSDDEVHGEPFLDRVKRSCTFFRSALTDAIAQPLERCEEIETGNKVTAQRLTAALTDMTTAYKTKTTLLADIAVRGFTIPTYLKSKQQALLTTIEGNTPQVKHKKKKKTKKKVGE